NIGFRPQNLWIGLITLPQAQYPDSVTRQHFVEQTLAALRETNGLQTATTSGDIPLLLAAASNTLYSRPDGNILPVDKRAAAANRMRWNCTGPGPRRIFHSWLWRCEATYRSIR